MNLPKQYSWLEDEKSPRILVEFLKHLGTSERLGPSSNPEIMKWAKRIGVSQTYTTDSIPWCGLGMGFVALQAGYEIPTNPLWARSWGEFGTHIDVEKAMLGDVLVFGRKGGGHVGIYIAEDKSGECFHVLGCNQNDTTSIKRLPKSRCITARRCKWRINQPPNIRKIFMDASGPISTNEA
jgi:uncharacterized protein (TIGR02594 family)